MQGLFARVGSGDPVRVLRLFHNNYTGYCCIHLLCRATYNLSLPRLSANYYRLPTTVQLRAAHESRCSLVGVSRSTALQVLYCTCFEQYHYGTVQDELAKLCGCSSFILNLEPIVIVYRAIYWGKIISKQEGSTKILDFVIWNLSKCN